MSLTCGAWLRCVDVTATALRPGPIYLSAHLPNTIASLPLVTGRPILAARPSLPLVSAARLARLPGSASAPLLRLREPNPGDPAAAKPFHPLLSLSLSGSASRAPWKRPPVAGARPPVGDPTALYKRDRLERPDPSLARVRVRGFSGCPCGCPSGTGSSALLRCLRRGRRQTGRSLTRCIDFWFGGVQP